MLEPRYLAATRRTGGESTGNPQVGTLPRAWRQLMSAEDFSRETLSLFTQAGNALEDASGLLQSGRVVIRQRRYKILLWLRQFGVLADALERRHRACHVAFAQRTDHLRNLRLRTFDAAQIFLDQKRAPGVVDVFGETGLFRR